MHAAFSSNLRIRSIRFSISCSCDFGKGGLRPNYPPLAPLERLLSLSMDHHDIPMFIQSYFLSARISFRQNCNAVPHPRQHTLQGHSEKIIVEHRSYDAGMLEFSLCSSAIEACARGSDTTFVLLE